MSEVSTAVGERVHPSMAIEPLRAIADRYGATYESTWGTGRVIESLFEECEPGLVRPTFVIGHPVEISPLARRPHDPFVTERFELFVDSRELANGYSELNDPVEQRERFEEEQAAKDAGDPSAAPSTRITCAPSTACRRLAGWESAWTAWRCCWPGSTTSAR